MLKNILLIIISTVFVNNIILVKIIGICPFLGVSKKIENSIGMGLAVIFVTTAASSITWIIQKVILEPFHIEYLQTLSFILVIAAFVQLVETVTKKISPGLYQALGIYLPLITTNCAVLAAAVITIQKNLNFIETVIYAFGIGTGFTLALIIFAGIREQLEVADIPHSFRGTAIALITSGLLALAFLGFSGMVK
ncbi:MAG: electron transport complex subunit RsxA [bacterium]